MYAVVKTGGKQYRVEPGQTIDVELLEGEVGAGVTFPEVLLVEKDGKTLVGKPYVGGAVVKAKIVGNKRAPKVIIFKKLRRHGQQLKKGHRQDLTTVLIESVQV